MHLGLVAKVALSALPLLAFAGVGPRPGPLRGVPLEGKTGLRLLVAHTRPFVLDVDRGSVTSERGVPSAKYGTTVVGVGGRSAVVSVAPTTRNGQLYAVPGIGKRASSLGPGMAVAPAPRGRSVWVERFVQTSHCTLRQVRLDGRVLRGPRPFRCVPWLAPGGSFGVQAAPTRIVDPMTGRTVFRSPRDRLNQRMPILAVAGRKVLLQDGSGRPLTLVDTATGTRQQIDWPKTVGSLDAPAVDMGGRRIAVAFANPSWTGAAGQASDVWILDTETARLTRLPGMPAFVALKWTNMAWTVDGRLVLVTKSADKQIVALWAPGQKRLHVKSVRLPNRDSVSSDTFAILG